MDLNELEQFINEKKRYSLYPTVGWDTTQKHNQVNAAKFFKDFYDEFSEWKEGSRKVSTDEYLYCDNCITNDVITHSVNDRCDICGCTSFSTLADLGYTDQELRFIADGV